MWHDEWHAAQARLAEHVGKCVEAFGELSNYERWNWLVEHGFIDRRGNFTTRIGGDAVPEEERFPLAYALLARDVG